MVMFPDIKKRPVRLCMWAGWLDLDLDWNRKKKYPNMTNRTSPSQGMGTQAKPHSSQTADDGYP